MSEILAVSIIIGIIVLLLVGVCFTRLILKSWF